MDFMVTYGEFNNSTTAIYSYLPAAMKNSQAFDKQNHYATSTWINTVQIDDPI